MKDTILTARNKKRELVILLVCFMIANLANLYAIIAYKTSFLEMITSIFYVIIFTVALYVFLGIMRIFFYLLKALLLKRSRGGK